MSHTYSLNREGVQIFFLLCLKIRQVNKKCHFTTLSCIGHTQTQICIHKCMMYVKVNTVTTSNTMLKNTSWYNYLHAIHSTKI